MRDRCCPIGPRLIPPCDCSVGMDPTAFDSPFPDRDDQALKSETPDIDGDLDCAADPEVDVLPAQVTKRTREDLKATRLLIRKAVARSGELAEVSADDRALVAKLLGSAVDLPSLTAAVCTAPRRATSPAADLLDVHQLPAGDQVIEIAFMAKPRAAALWGLLTELGVVRGTRPAADIRAAKASIAGLNALKSGDIDRLNRAVILIKGA